MADEKMIDKIQALIAKAEDAGCTQAEAEAFMAKAQELMTRYSIEATMFRARREVHEDPTTERIDIDTWLVPSAGLLWAIAEANDCQVWRMKSRQGRRGYAMIAGFPNDIENVKLLFASLLIQVHRFSMEAEVPLWEHAKTYRLSFREGFNTGIRDRLMAARNQEVAKADEEYSGSLLPALIDKTAMVESLLPDGLVAETRRVRGSGLGDGHTAAQRADVGNPGIRNQAAIGGGR